MPGLTAPLSASLSPAVLAALRAKYPQLQSGAQPGAMPASPMPAAPAVAQTDAAALSDAQRASVNAGLNDFQNYSPYRTRQEMAPPQTLPPTPVAATPQPVPAAPAASGSALPTPGVAASGTAPGLNNYPALTQYLKDQQE